MDVGFLHDRRISLGEPFALLLPLSLLFIWLYLRLESTRARWLWLTPLFAVLLWAKMTRASYAFPSASFHSQDLTYTANQLDRDVVSESQIRTVLQQFRDKVLPDAFPGRKEVPKTLIFAKDVPTLMTSSEKSPVRT